MRSIIALFILLYTFSFAAVSQVARKPLPKGINTFGRDHKAPSMSGDGRTMIYLSTYSASETFELKYVKKSSAGVWNTPQDVKEVNKYLDLNFLPGFCLSYDGNTIYFTTKRGQGIGGYDILYTEKKNGQWTPAKNVGKPINSSSNDGSPSISPDGQYLYFMRCDKMSKNGAEDCSIWVSKRRNKDLWNTPTKLPSPVNKGNAQMPRIMPDNKTLIFASDRSGGKGGYDLYESKNLGGSWSRPVPLDFINTAGNERIASVTAKGNEIYFAAKFRGNDKIIKSRLPKEYQGENVILMEGKVVDEATGAPLKAFVQVYDAKTKKRIQYVRSSEKDGSFFAIFPVEGVCDFSVQAVDKDHFYYSKLYFGDSIENSKKEIVTIKLKSIRSGLSLIGENIMFGEGTADLLSVSELELKRLLKVLKSNSHLNLEIGVHMDEVLSDSIQSDADLTEVKIDTMFIESHYEEEEMNEDAELEDSNEEEGSFEEITEDEIGGVIIQEFELEYTYHNDRTQKKAEAILNYFLAKGVPEHRIIATGHGDEKRISNDPEKNRRVEFRFVRN